MAGVVLFNSKRFTMLEDDFLNNERVLGSGEIIDGKTEIPNQYFNHDSAIEKDKIEPPTIHQVGSCNDSIRGIDGCNGTFRSQKKYLFKK